MNYLNFAGGKKIVYNLNRDRSKVLRQCITDFKQYGVCRNKGAVFKFGCELDGS